MKKLLLIVTILSSFSVLAGDSQEYREETMKARGEKDISIGTILSPPGFGAVGRAEMQAKKNLKAKCKQELNGKIVGEIKYETIRFDEGIMAAIVEATGTCRY